MNMKDMSRKYIEIGVAGNLVNATMSNDELDMPKKVALAGLSMEASKLLKK